MRRRDKAADCPTKTEAERQELVAYDVLALLIGVLGVDDVLSTLRLWYVVSSLDDKGRRRRALQRPK